MEENLRLISDLHSLKLKHTRIAGGYEENRKLQYLKSNSYHLYWAECTRITREQLERKNNNNSGKEKCVFLTLFLFDAGCVWKRAWKKFYLAPPRGGCLQHNNSYAVSSKTKSKTETKTNKKKKSLWISLHVLNKNCLKLKIELQFFCNCILIA